MNTCPACGAPAAPEMNFCGACGARLAITCPNCEAQNPRFYKFCGNCGSPLEAELASAPRPERRLVTILFADVQGFVAATAGLDPEIVAGIMNRYFARVADVIARYGGTIDKYMGDAVMALFGAPVSFENDAERAVRAALSMQQSLSEFRTIELGTRQIRLQLRIGIASGEVLFGPVGGQSARFTALGEPVNLASRLESVAPVGGVLVSGETYQLTKGLFVCDEVTGLRLNGFRGPITGYRVISAPTHPGRQRSLPGAAARYVGREAEIGALEAAFAAAGRGHPRVVLVTGEAGCGKSRLLTETISLLGDQVSVAVANAYPHNQVVAYALLRELVTALAGCVRTGSQSIDDVLIQVYPSADDRALVQSILHAREMGVLSRAQPEDPSPRLAAVTAQLVRYVSYAKPLLCVLDDVQWADAASIDVLSCLLDALPRMAFLLVLVSRLDSDIEARIHLPADSTRITLNPLPLDVLQHLLVELSGPDALPPGLADDVLRRAAGNPFYLEELVRSLFDTGALVGPPGKARFAGSADVALVPATLRSLITARVDRLPSAERLVLQHASVIGQVVELDLLRSFSEQPAFLEFAIAKLEAGRFLEVDPARTGSYRFRHPLMREVVYSTLSLSERRSLHRAAAAALEARGVSQESAGVLLYHHQRGEQPERVAIVARQAATMARRLSAPNEAVALLSAALDALMAQSAPRVTDGLEEVATLPAKAIAGLAGEIVDVLLERGDLLLQLGRAEAAMADYQQALVVAGANHLLRAAAFSRLGEAHERAGDLGGALETLSQGVAELSGGFEVTPEMARLLASLSLILYKQGDVDQAAEVYQRSIRLGSGYIDHREISRVYLALNRPQDTPAAWADAEFHRWQTALAEVRERGDSLSEARVLVQTGSHLARRRDFPAAIVDLTRSIGLWIAAGELNSAAGTLLNLGIVQQSAGELRAARGSLRHAEDLYRQTHDQRGLARAKAQLGALAVSGGETATGISLVEQAIAIAQSVGANEQLPEFFVALARAQQAAGSREQAEAAAANALEWARRIGNRYFEDLAAGLLAKLGSENTQEA